MTTINLDALEESKIANLEVGGDNYKTGGQTTVYDPMTLVRLGTVNPLVSNFFKNPVKPNGLLSRQFKYSVYTGDYFIDGRLQPGEASKEIQVGSKAVIAYLGKMGFVKKWAREEILSEINQAKMGGKVLETGGADDIIRPAEEELLTKLNQNIDQYGWDGTFGVGDTFGISGIKTQHQLVNGTTFSDGGVRNDNHSYTNDSTGQQAFIDRVLELCTMGMRFGASHFTLQVPFGAGKIVKEIYNDYVTNAPVLEHIIVALQRARETAPAGSAFATMGTADAFTRTLDSFLDVQELFGMSTKEAYLYPDTVNGRWQYQTYEFSANGSTPDGVRTLVQGADDVLSQLGLQGLPKRNQDTSTNVDTVALEKVWTGFFHAPAVGMATLFSEVVFSTVSSLHIEDYAEDGAGTIIDLR